MKTINITERKASTIKPMSIRMTQAQQDMLRREARKRGLRIRDLINRSLKFYIMHGGNPP